MKIRHLGTALIAAATICFVTSNGIAGDKPAIDIGALPNSQSPSPVWAATGKAFDRGDGKYVRFACPTQLPNVVVAAWANPVQTATSKAEKSASFGLCSGSYANGRQMVVQDFCQILPGVGEANWKQIVDPSSGVAVGWSFWLTAGSEAQVNAITTAQVFDGNFISCR